MNDLHEFRLDECPSCSMALDSPSAEDLCDRCSVALHEVSVAILAYETTRLLTEEDIVYVM